MGEVWAFTRRRLDATIESMDDGQALWRPAPNCHCAAEYFLHIAAAEEYWAARLLGLEQDANCRRLERCLFGGFLSEGAFEYPNEELSLELARIALEGSRTRVRPLFEGPTEEALAMKLSSPIGDPVTGREGLCRLAQHAGYHTGQVVLLSQLPGYPTR